MPRSKDSYVEGGRKGAKTARQRYGPDFHRQRGLQAIANSRARGKHPPPLERPCVVCGTPFRVPRSRARIKRCPGCIAKGRAVCMNMSCGAEVQVRPGSSPPHVLCDCCREVAREKWQEKRFKEITCLGASTPWGTHHAKRCERTYRRDPKRATTLSPNGRTFVCGRCSTLERLVRKRLPRLERLYYRITSLKEFLDVLGQHMSKAGPAAWRAQRGNPPGLIAARREGKGGGRGQPLSTAMMAAAWKDRLAEVALVQCLWCDKLLMMATARTATPKRFHDRCWDEVLRTDEVRAWVRERNDLRRQGRPAATIGRTIGFEPPLPHPGRGRRRHPANIKRYFGWAVRHYLRGVAMRQIAEEEDVSTPEVSQRVKEILTLLPDPELVDRRFAKYLVALRASAAIRRERAPGKEAS